MKRRNLFFAAIMMAMLSLAVFSSCNEDEKPDPVEKPAFHWTDVSGSFEGGVLTVAAEGGAIEVAYVLENPIEGAVLETKTEASWITSITAADGKFAFQVAANDQAEARDAKITITYPELIPAPELTVRQVAAEKKSDNVISIFVDKIGARSADYRVEVTNEDPYAVTIFPAAEVQGKSEEDIVKMIVATSDKLMLQTSIASTFSGLIPETAYAILAVGMENDKATTGLIREDFTTVAEKPVSDVSISATYDEYYDMHEIAEIDPDFEFYTAFGDCFMPIFVTTTPEDAMFWMGVFVNSADLTDEVLMNELMARPPAPNKDDASALWYDKEYIIAAVAQNADGEMCNIWRSEPFTLTKDGASDAQGFFDYANGGGDETPAVSVTATYNEYYDMHEIAEIDPDFEFYTSFGDCFMPIFVTTTPEDAMFWMGVFVNSADLTDEVLMNELMARPPAPNKDDASALWYDKEYVIAAVAQNADGEMCDIWRSEPFTLTKDGAADAQGFFDYANGGASGVPARNHFNVIYAVER